MSQQDITQLENEINYLHHIGHVVNDMGMAQELYRRLGFLCTTPTYPIISFHDDEPAKPFGAANMHANFSRNFIEIMTVVTKESSLPKDAQPIPLLIPPAVRPRVIENIENTIAKISTSLSRFEGLHILVFHTEDASTSARHLTHRGVGHSGINKVQQSHQSLPMGVIEIDKEDIPEGRIAVAENTLFQPAETQPLLTHPNGAIELVEAILCTPDTELEHYVKRYQHYLGRVARKDGSAYIFDLQQSRLKLIASSYLAQLFPGEATSILPAFVAYTVTVQDLSATHTFLANNGFTIKKLPDNAIFITAKDALGAAIIFRQARVDN